MFSSLVPMHRNFRGLFLYKASLLITFIRKKTLKTNWKRSNAFVAIELNNKLNSNWIEICFHSTIDNWTVRKEFRSTFLWRRFFSEKKSNGDRRLSNFRWTRNESRSDSEFNWNSTFKTRQWKERHGAFQHYFCSDEIRHVKKKRKKKRLEIDEILFLQLLESIVFWFWQSQREVN